MDLVGFKLGLVGKYRRREDVFDEGVLSRDLVFYRALEGFARFFVWFRVVGRV